MKTCSVYCWNQKENNAKNKCSSLQQGYLFICLFIFDYKALYVSVKEKPCLKIAIAAYCFIFGGLFYLFIKKLIFGSKII